MNKCKFSQLFRETYSIKRTNIKLYTSDFPGGSVVKESALQRKEHRFDSWSGN